MACSQMQVCMNESRKSARLAFEEGGKRLADSQIRTDKFSLSNIGSQIFRSNRVFT